MVKRISVSDLIQHGDREKIDTAGLEDDGHSAYADTREEILKLLETGSRPRATKRNNDFYDVVPKTVLEMSISRILQKKEEDPDAVRARRSFKYEFDRKMARIKRIKSKTYRRMRRIAKLKNQQVAGVAGEGVDGGGCDGAGQISCVPDDLLREMETQEEGVTPILSFDGPSETPQNTQHDLVRLAFGDNADDNEREFMREKEEIVNSEAPRTEEVVLPGWGDWAGPGLELVKTRENTTVYQVDGVKYFNRKDFNRSHVVINEKALDVDGKFQAELPFGHTEEEYNARIKMSISKEWNTLRIFKKLVKTKPGHANGGVIEPFRYEHKD